MQCINGYQPCKKILDIVENKIGKFAEIAQATYLRTISPTRAASFSNASRFSSM
jgi:hypothetical protein